MERGVSGVEEGSVEMEERKQEGEGVRGGSLRRLGGEDGWICRRYGGRMKTDERGRADKKEERSNAKYAKDNREQGKLSV